MPIPRKYLADISAGSVYHIYNRTNNKELLFLNDANRFFFLERFELYLSDFLEPYAWNLLSNHFHLMVKIKSEEVICKSLKKKNVKFLTGSELDFIKGKLNLETLMERAFRRFFQSYAISFNKYHDRKGNLFYRPFKRHLVETDEQFTNTLLYIHSNAFRHGIVTDFRDHDWSSWHELFQKERTWLLKEEVTEWFGGKNNMIRTHLHHTKHFGEPDENMDVFV